MRSMSDGHAMEDNSNGMVHTQLQFDDSMCLSKIASDSTIQAASLFAFYVNIQWYCWSMSVL